MEMEIDDLDDDECGASAATKEQIVLATREIKKAHSRNRKKRRKVFTHVIDYLDGIIPAAYEMHKNYLMGNLVQWMDELVELFVEVLKLLLPLLDQGNQTDDLKYETSTFSNVLEAFLLHLKQWCFDQNSSDSPQKPFLNFLALTFKFLTEIVVLVSETDSWRYVDVINIPVTFILVEWGKTSKRRAAAKLLNWTQNTSYAATLLEKKISKCGDFACQYFLVILVQQWLTWAGNEVAEQYLNSAFPSVGIETKKLLLENGDFDLVGRNFLNAINVTVRGSRAKAITSVPCLYFFAGEEQMKPPEDSDQLWVDFSAASRRIHSFFAIPSNAWINFNLDSEQIDSICVSWVRRNEGQSQFMPETQTQDFTQKSNMELDCLIFLHLQLKDSFSEISHDLEDFHDHNICSLTLVFQDLGVIERVLHQMSFPTHSNGEMCKRPKKLMDIVEESRQLIGSQAYVDVIETPGGFHVPCSGSDGENESRSLIGSNAYVDVIETPGVHGPSSSPDGKRQIPSDIDMGYRKDPNLITANSSINLTMESIIEGSHSYVDVIKTPGEFHVPCSNPDGERQSRRLIGSHAYVDVIETPGGFHIPWSGSDGESQSRSLIGSNVDVIETPGGFHGPSSGPDGERQIPSDIDMGYRKDPNLISANSSINLTMESIIEGSHSYVDVIKTPGGIRVPCSSPEILSDIDRNYKKHSNLITANNSMNVTMESMMEDPLPRAIRENMKLKSLQILNKSVPCYKRELIVNKTSVRDINSSQGTQDQFVDPYDITAEDGFLLEKQMRTYSRKRKRQPVRSPKKSTVPLITTGVDSDEELCKLIKGLPPRSNPLKEKKKLKKKSRPKKLPPKSIQIESGEEIMQPVPRPNTPKIRKSPLANQPPSNSIQLESDEEFEEIMQPVPRPNTPKIRKSSLADQPPSNSIQLESDEEFEEIMQPVSRPDTPRYRKSSLADQTFDWSNIELELENAGRERKKNEFRDNDSFDWDNLDELEF